MTKITILLIFVLLNCVFSNNVTCVNEDYCLAQTGLIYGFSGSSNVIQHAQDCAYAHKYINGKCTFQKIISTIIPEIDIADKMIQQNRRTILDRIQKKYNYNVEMKYEGKYFGGANKHVLVYKPYILRTNIVKEETCSSNKQCEIKYTCPKYYHHDNKYPTCTQNNKNISCLEKGVLYVPQILNNREHPNCIYLIDLNLGMNAKRVIKCIQNCKLDEMRNKCIPPSSNQVCDLGIAFYPTGCRNGQYGLCTTWSNPLCPSGSKLLYVRKVRRYFDEMQGLYSPRCFPEWYY